MLSKEELANLLINDVDAFNNELGGKAIDMSEMDFSGVNLEGAVFDNVDLTSSSFADANLTEVKFLGWQERLVTSTFLCANPNWHLSLGSKVAVV